MINMLRHESCSGAIQDLAHVATADMFADCQTKHKAPVGNLRDVVETGRLLNCDKQPSFRKLMEKKNAAFCMLSEWIVRNLKPDVVKDAQTFLCRPVADGIRQALKRSKLA